MLSLKLHLKKLLSKTVGIRNEFRVPIFAFARCAAYIIYKSGCDCANMKWHLKNFEK